MRNVLIVNYRNMDVGGIENYIIGIINTALKDGYKIIWLSDVHPVVNPIYKQILTLDAIERVPCNTHDLHWFQHPRIDLSVYDKVVILSFGFLDHIRGLELIKDASCAEKFPWFIIPHFTGGILYPESNFEFLKNPVREFCGKMYSCFIQSGEMMYMASNHPDSLEQAYGLVIPKEKRIQAPSVYQTRPFDEERIRRNYRNKNFIIVSAGRLDFPHKGFLLGLIDEFAELKKSYDFLKLCIIGDGVDRDVLLKKVDKLPKFVRKDIEYTGMMPRDQLLDVYEKCNLSISVAGCASEGARLGLLTLPARHYTEKCEVYGFIPISKMKTTSVEPGEPVRKYIEQAIHMTEDEYVQWSRQSYESYDKVRITLDDFTKNTEGVRKYYPTKWTIFCAYFLSILEKIAFKIKYKIKAER